MEIPFIKWFRFIAPTLWLQYLIGSAMPSIVPQCAERLAKPAAEEGLPDGGFTNSAIPHEFMATVKSCTQLSRTWCVINQAAKVPGSSVASLAERI